LRVHEDFKIFDTTNTQIGDPNDFDPNTDSDFESIILDASTGDMYAIREAIDVAHPDNNDKYQEEEDSKYHSIIMKLSFNSEYEKDATDFSVVDACPCEYQFEGRLNGLEGAVALRGKDGVLYILVLTQTRCKTKYNPLHTFFLNFSLCSCCCCLFHMMFIVN
jgi:hypothetical protein